MRYTSHVNDARLFLARWLLCLRNFALSLGHLPHVLAWLEAGVAFWLVFALAVEGSDQSAGFLVRPTHRLRALHI